MSKTHKEEKIRGRKRRSLTSLRTKTWFKTHIGSISFKTEHKLVNLCIAASNLSLEKAETLKSNNYVITQIHLAWSYYDIHFDRTIIFRKAFMAR